MEPTGIISDFLQRALADRDAGRLGPLESYQWLYPGYESLIAEEYAVLLAGEKTTEIRRAEPELPHPLAAFEGAWRADLAAGARRTLAEYLALIPGDPAGISARHAELVTKRREADPEPEAASGGLPRRFGNYRLDEEIGRGGQGLVFRAEDLRLGRPVALKILNGHGLASPEAVRRFTREAAVASRLDDPCICAVYEAGAFEGAPYIAMRFVEGETLATLISAQRGPNTAPTVGGPTQHEGSRASQTAPGAALDASGGGAGASTGRADLAAALLLIEKVARSLHRAHEDGVVHRDLKPGNIMVTPAGEPVILDFGLAAAEAEDLSTITRSGDIQGTLPYMSPEQVGGRVHEIDRRTDVYGLGATLYEAVTRHRPFNSPTREGLMRAIEIQDPPDPRRFDRRLPRDLKIVLETALAKDPDRRYATALDLAEDLRRLREREPIAARPISTVRRAVLWARRRPAMAALLLCLGVGVSLLTASLGFITANLPAIEAQDEQDRLGAVDALLQAGYGQLGEGSPEKARRHFEEAQRRMPDRPEGVAGLALSFRYRDDHEGALAVLTARPDLLARHRGLRALQADTLTSLERHAEARTITDGLGEPRSAMDFFLAGTLKLHRAHFHGEKESYRAAFALLRIAVHCCARAQPLYHFELAHAVGHLAEVELANPVALGITGLWPRSARAWYWAAYAVLQADPETALDGLERSLEIEEDVAETQANKAWALTRLGRYAESEGPLRRAIELDPRNARYHEDLTSTLFKLERYEEAIATGRRAIELNPADPDALHDMGVSLSRLGRKAEAERTLRTYLDQVPGDPNARCDLANLMGAQGRVDDAIAELEIALAADPGHVGSQRTLALALSKRGDVEAAHAAYEKLMTLAPDDATCHYDYGTFLSKDGQPEDGAAHLLEALRLDPGYDLAWYDLGIARSRLDDLPGAVAANRRSVERRPEHAESWCNLGRTLARLGRYREALTALERGHALGTASGTDWAYPSGDWVSEAEELLADLERLEAALSASRRLPEDPEALRELIDIAETAQRPADAVRLYRALLGENGVQRPALLYAAARAAARAALASDNRESFEDAARRWLAEALALCERERERGAVPESRILRRVEQWREDPVWESFGSESWDDLWKPFVP